MLHELLVIAQAIA